MRMLLGMEDLRTTVYAKFDGGGDGAKRVYYEAFENRESSFPKYSETSIKRTPKGCKNCAMFVNDQHSTVTLYCDKVACC